MRNVAFKDNYLFIMFRKLLTVSHQLVSTLLR